MIWKSQKILEVDQYCYYFVVVEVFVERKISIRVAKCSECSNQHRHLPTILAIRKEHRVDEQKL